MARNALGISFPQGWYDGSIILVTKRPNEDRQKFAAFLWLRPFSDSVWILILLSIVASGVVYWVLELIDHKSDRARLQNSPLENIFLSAVTFTGHFEFQPRTNASRLFTISLTFWALMTAAAYTANLASFLVVEHTPTISIESIEDAVRMRAPICVLASTQTDNAVTNAFPNARLVRKRQEEDVYHGVSTGECTVAATTASAWNYYERQSQVNGACELQWVGRVFRNVPAGFGMRSDSGTLCTSLIRDVMNLHLLEMKQDGFMDEAWDDYLARVSDTDCGAGSDSDLASSDEQTQQQLDLESMGGVFVFHFGLSFVAIVMALFSVNIKKIRKRYAKKTLTTDLALRPEQYPGDDRELSAISEDFSEATQLQIVSLRSEVKRLTAQQRNQTRSIEDQVRVIGDLSSQVKRMMRLLEKNQSGPVTTTGSSIPHAIGTTSLMVGNLEKR